MLETGGPPRQHTHTFPSTRKVQQRSRYLLFRKATLPASMPVSHLWMQVHLSVRPQAPPGPASCYPGEKDSLQQVILKNKTKQNPTNKSSTTVGAGQMDYAHLWNEARKM